MCEHKPIQAHVHTVRDMDRKQGCAAAADTHCSDGLTTRFLKRVYKSNIMCCCDCVGVCLHVCKYITDGNF